MDMAAAIAVSKKVYKVAKQVKKYYNIDQGKRIVFLQTLHIARFLGDIPDFYCDDFRIKDGYLSIFPTGDREPFCDGASLAPDQIGKLKFVKAAAGHDAMYSQLENIAAAWGWTVDNVRKLADDMFGDLLVAEADRAGGIWSPIGKLVARIYHGAVRLFGGVYHDAKKTADILILCAISAIALTVGCAWEPVCVPTDDEPVYYVTNILSKIEASIKEDKKEPQSLDAIDYSSLDWRYGGFNGSGAVHNPAVVIKDLKITSSGMSYNWQSGGCEQLGAKDRSDAACIAALFCLVDGRWVGGKFEWISTSRLTRSWHNIGGYNGWSMTVFNAATKYAFVIVSKDGRQRSNIIVSE